MLELPSSLPAGHTSLPVIHLEWHKGHPERSETPPAAWSRQQWGIFIADRLAKSQDICSLPYSPIPTIPLPDLLRTMPPQGAWQWAGPACSPPLRNLRSTLSYHWALAYRTNRDTLRGHRGAPPLWLASLLSTGIPSGNLSRQPLCKRVHSLRTLWDLRWHDENRAVAAHSMDPQVSACPICNHYWSQEHVLCDFPSTTDARLGGTLDLNITIYRLIPGHMLDLGRHFQSLLTVQNQPNLRARRWSGQWDPGAIAFLKPDAQGFKRFLRWGTRADDHGRPRSAPTGPGAVGGPRRL